MKQKLNYLLFALLIGSLNLAVTSCKDDSISEEQRKAEEEAAQAEKASKFWDVVGQLVSMNDYTPDFEGKTFEPIIGYEDPNDLSTRIISTNTMEAAASSFAGLIGAHNIDENTMSHEWSDPEIGSLNYRKVANGTAWAEVTVDIPAVPHLSKIIYRSAEQGNTNGGVTNDGRAYYRFGDVIRRTNEDGYVEYWVCIRPAFDPEAKGDTHWATVSPLPRKNLWPNNKDGSGYMASNGREYILPTGLSYKMEHLQNLAELLFAISYPNMWYRNIQRYNPTIFHDFGSSRISYHNNVFWENVQRAWEKKDVAKKVFGKDLSWFAGNISENGLYFLYKGHSWWTWTENGPTLYQVHYTNTPETKYCNMQTKDPDSKVQHDVVDKRNHTADIDFNVKEECTLAKPYIEKPAFFGDANPRWIVRIAEGKELAKNGKYGNNQMPIDGVEEVYRYYRDVIYSPNLDKEPEITLFSGVINNDQATQNISKFEGEPFYKPCAVYKDQNEHRWFVAYPAGIVHRDRNNVEILTGSPYSYLVSLEGINYTPDKKRATNLPSRDLAIKMTMSLMGMATNVARAPTEAQLREQAKTNLGPSLVSALNVLDHADIHLSSLFLQTLPKSGNRENTAWQISVAYKDDNSNQQKLLRFVNHPDNDQRQPMYYVWEHYPEHPSDTEFEPNNFSDNYIYLQDLTSSDFVGMYGPDAFACRPITEEALGDNRTPRQYRKANDTEPKAQDVTNYFYQRGPWLTRTYPTDMWKEPVLFMRVTRVYDRGTEYSNITTDGLILQQVHENPFMDLATWDWLTLRAIFAGMVGEGLQDVTIDGKKWTPTTWQQDVIR